MGAAPYTESSRREVDSAERRRVCSVSRCMAVGGWTKSSSIPAYSLSESWNGSVWTLQATPNPSGSMISALYGVACASANDCVAVGSHWNGSITQTLAEAYSG